MSYTLSFEYAGSQLTNDIDGTWQELRVGLDGSALATTPSWINPSRGFTAWQTYSTTFTAPTSGTNLSFEAFGYSVTGSGPSRPMLLLDNVQLSENTPPPSVPGPLPAAGAAAAFAWSRRLRGHN
jgi:MYXO-CTERM domain-containing protein